MSEISGVVLTLPATLRTEFGTGPARALRKTNRIPAIIYGAGEKNLAIALEEKEITKLYRKPNFVSTVLQLEINGKKYKVLPKLIELHPVKEIVRHVDFTFLGKDTHKLQLPISFENKEKSVGIKRGGYFNIVKRSLPVECSSKVIPSCIVVDVSVMLIGQSLKAEHLNLPPHCKLLCPSNTIIASIIGNRGAKAEDEAKTP